MTGSNKPPAYGTREQVEQDNQVWVYADTPRSEAGPGTEAETDPGFRDLDAMTTAAMKDADPSAHREGLIEDATISLARIMAVGGAISMLGRDAAQPQTRTEATYDSTDTGIYGHANDSDIEKQRDIVNQSMTLDSNGVPLADGKIDTIYTQARIEEAIAEERRKEEEDRTTAYLIAEAIDDMWGDDDWYEPTMTFEEFEAESQRVDQHAGTTIQTATQTSQRMRDYIQDNQQYGSRVLDMHGEALRQRDALSRQLDRTTDPATRAALEERVRVLTETADNFRRSHEDIAARGNEIGAHLRANEADIAVARQGQLETRQALENLRNMTPEQAKAQALSDLRERLEYERSHPREGQDSEQQQTLMRRLERRISDLESGRAGDPKRAYQAMLEGRLQNFDSQLQQLDRKAEAIDNAVQDYRAYQQATEDYQRYLLEMQQMETPSADQIAREAELRQRMLDAGRKSDESRTYLSQQSRDSAAANAHTATDPTTTATQAQASDAARSAHQDAGALTDQNLVRDLDTRFRTALTGVRARDGALDRGTGADLDRVSPAPYAGGAGGRGGWHDREPATPAQKDAAISRAIEVFYDAKTNGRQVTVSEWNELRDLPGMNWRAMREVAEGMQIQVPPRDEVWPRGPSAAAGGATTGAPYEYDYDRFASLESDYSLFGNSNFSQTRVPYSPIQPVGYSGSPLVSNNFGITGGSNVGSFADSEDFTRYDPKPQETGGVVPSYSKPWYESAWDSISSLWNTKPAVLTTPVPGQQTPQVMLAADTTTRGPGATAGSGSGGAMA